jgi:hypothetical protein
MARKYQMTWQASTRRWFKKHRGTIYAVSCRQLKAPETKEGSAGAANAWWEAKLAEIENAPPTEQELRANAFKVWSMVQDWQHLDEGSRERLVDSLIGVGQYQKLRTQADSIVQATALATPPERTVSAQVENWKKLLEGVCLSAQMSEGRFDAYCRNIQNFVDWVGPETSIDDIDEAKLEGFFNHLTVQVGAKKYSPNYAHTLMMTAKQFISRLAELRLVPLPGNIRSRRFRFNHSVPAKVETFSLEELRAILKAADGLSERTKLFVLLAVNCGMYQNDMAELLKAEINFTAGTLMRARSKTRERQGPVVTYKLWPETLKLLKKYRAEAGELAITTDKGKPLVRYWVENGKMRRYDCVHAAWRLLAEPMGLKKMRLGLKHLRKTGASLLAQHPQYKFYIYHYLADSPKNVADKHYVTPSNEEFFAALDWLGEQVLGRKSAS